MVSAEYEQETGVDDDLTEIVRTGDKLKHSSLWYRMIVGVPQLKLGEDPVGLELLIPSSQEDDGG